MGETTLTNSEWNVLNCLWKQSPMTVMQLVAVLRETTGWAKSTTITTLRRMEKKGLLCCEHNGRTRRYFPQVERQQAAAHETSFFLDKVYRGSVGRMVAAMARNNTLSREEIDGLYLILKQAEKGQM
ncbi:MAG: BlaI/MecI/CopY family transcriptional regulator [Lawsonibacter sp.]|nr:BlaI/MecI/CopY family transcriptional regulator [Lawsonibacter sp.]